LNDHSRAVALFIIEIRSVHVRQSVREVAETACFVVVHMAPVPLHDPHRGHSVVSL
jgi:hypothetical protein